MNNTKIGWVKNPDGSQGCTWNPITGCLKGCKYCFARKMANGRWLKTLYLANTHLAPTMGEGIVPYKTGTLIDSLNPFYPRFWPERIDRARLELAGAKPRGIFVCDMGELFGEWLPAVWREEIFDLFREFPRHRFYLLTKQPQNLVKFSPFPGNCWVGVTATDTKMALEACLKLGDIEASVRYLSIEPMLNQINLPPEHLKVCKIGWVIIGAQTNPYKSPKIEWVKEIVEACDKAGIPVFLKENLRPLIHSTPLKQLKGMYVKGYKLRQEMPR